MSYLTKVITLSVVFDKLRAMLFFCAIILIGDSMFEEIKKYLIQEFERQINEIDKEIYSLNSVIMQNEEISRRRKKY